MKIIYSNLSKSNRLVLSINISSAGYLHIVFAIFRDLSSDGSRPCKRFVELLIRTVSTIFYTALQLGETLVSRLCFAQYNMAISQPPDEEPPH